MCSNTIWTSISSLILLRHLGDFESRGREKVLLFQIREQASLFLEDLARCRNRTNVDQIVFFPHLFSYFKNQYGCEYGCCQM
jgi:hypothetical protein